jgi:hypothetical protein
MSVSGTDQMHWLQYRLCEYAGYDSLHDMIVHRTRWSNLDRLIIMLGCRFDSETGLCICEVAVVVTVKLYYVVFNVSLTVHHDVNQFL